MNLVHKTVLITGASSGIGRALAVELAKRKNRLVLTARRKELLDSLVTEIEAAGGEALAVPADALDGDEAERVVREAIERFERIDVAVLNVGDGPVFNMAKITSQQVLGNMRVNYDTFVHYLIPVMEHMKPFREGMIVHTNSLAGFLGLPMQGPYSAAKAAARILMDTCRIELRSYNLKFVSVHPGFIKTAAQLTYDQPMPMALSEEQAAKHMVRAMEKGSRDYMFPWVYKMLIKLAGILPKGLLGKILLIDLPEEYG
ncbi:MAG: SDR family NAD(P)-dependent oxidoreductase [Polyangiales bacterium]